MQFGNWGKICLGIPTAKSWGKWLEKGGLSKAKKTDAELSREAEKKEWEASNHGHGKSKKTETDEIIMVARVRFEFFLIEIGGWSVEVVIIMITQFYSRTMLSFDSKFSP
jgi:hypothetical protein